MADVTAWNKGNCRMVGAVRWRLEDRGANKWLPGVWRLWREDMGMEPYTCRATYSPQRFKTLRAAQLWATRLIRAEVRRAELLAKRRGARLDADIVRLERKPRVGRA